MPASDASDRDPGPARETGSAVYEGFLDVLLTGVAIVFPVVVTLYLVQIAIEFIGNALTPVIAVLEYLGLIERFERVELIGLLIELNVYGFVVDFLTELIALVILFGIVLLVGSVGHNRYGERIIDAVDLAIASIPGVGTVYKSFRRMGDVVLDSEAENFQDVKLVRCLDEDMYVLGFETSAAPGAVEDSTGNDEMVTLFVPMAPNPVTGGFLTYVPRERVFEVDMTVEEGVRSILTSGVATGKGATGSGEFGLADVESVATVDRLEDALSMNRTEDSDD